MCPPSFRGLRPKAAGIARRRREIMRKGEAFPHIGRPSRGENPFFISVPTKSGVVRNVLYLHARTSFTSPRLDRSSAGGKTKSPRLGKSRGLDGLAWISLQLSCDGI